MDADEPRKKQVMPVIGEDISTLSADELRERVALLEAEIARHAAAITAREATRSAAETFFKR